MFDEFFTAFQGAGRAVIRGVDLEAFNAAAAAAAAAEAAAKLPPCAATCIELERYLGLMFGLFFDAPLFWEKPLHQRQSVVDAIEATGVALAADSRRGH
ncbi:hypothetical protein I5589_05520 [Burkholderia vietnamiensis]|uniref:Transcriptional regulator TetR C-terminal Proteobacteria type domain-containing protein n=1 Tax=Burkholderia vietnamiensis TaxID=60552 RepID=A0ABS1AQW0_BURVI|nr:hypothetical protein [Burkholderia vietnamiensis]MBJ9686538.1 hypothetical protein [Burkholderia vietnamiensis]